ncbi:MAG: glycosyltransferase family 4 protein [Acidimicrobiales bacterium]
MATQALHVTFVLPKLTRYPVGGFKVHYQYANALAARNHKVTVLHPATPRRLPTVRDLAWYARVRSGRFLLDRPPVPWFDLDERIDVALRSRLTPTCLPKADITVLTAWQTAERTIGCRADAGALVQIVYDYEHWQAEPSLRPRMKRALGRKDVHQIATSTAVATLLHEIGRAPIALIPSGLQSDEFGLDEPTGERSVVGFALRPGQSKDMDTAFAAADAIRLAVPSTRIECFGDPRLPVPDGVTSLGRLSSTALRAFYNRVAVFMLTSRYEGWGLPAAEAMACGAAVVSTRNGGTEDFVRHGHNGLLVPVGDPEVIASSVVWLLEHGEDRKRIASQAASDARAMTVDRSVDRIENLLWALSRPESHRVAL